MADYVEFIAKSSPTDLLQKDWGKRKFYFHKNEIAAAHKLHDMEVREDDIWLVTLPKSDDKFMQEIIRLILNNYDFGSAKKEDLNEKSQHFEINENLEKTLLSAESLKSPRLITTHLPLPMLPAQVWRKKPKLIYVYRDPKDAQVSFYLDNRNNEIMKNKSCEQFLSDYMDMDNNSSFEHVNEFYLLRNEPWVFYTSFERMVSNLREVNTEVVQLLEKSITDSQMERMLQYFSNNDIKSNPKSGFLSTMDKVLRKVKRVFERPKFQNEEKIGISKKKLSPEFYAKFEKWIEDELKKYNVTLFELLLINNDVNQDNNEFHEKGNSNKKVVKEKDSNEKDNEEGEKNDSDDNTKVVEITIINNKAKEDNTLIEDSNNVEVEDKEVNDIEKDDIDNTKVQKEDSTNNFLLVDIGGDNTEFEKKDNAEVEVDNSKDNEEIVTNDCTNVNKVEMEYNTNDNEEVEKLENNNEIVEKKISNDNEEVEMKGNNDTGELEKIDNEIVKNDQTVDNEEVKLNDGKDSENVEMKDIESDKVEKKETEDDTVQSTHL